MNSANEDNQSYRMGGSWEAVERGTTECRRANPRATKSQRTNEKSRACNAEECKKQRVSITDFKERQPTGSDT